WWWVRQGLDGSLAKASAAEALERSGWCRSVGGAGPYLSIFARTGASRESIDADVKTVQLHELPSARGCTYVVPASDFGIALRAGQGGDGEMAMARKFLGVTDKEIEKLSRDVVDAVAKKPLDPRGLKDALGDKVRTLGAEGKKRGTTTTLPLALGKLQNEGRIRRVPVNGRLDQQRYAYVAWKPPPKTDFSEETLAVELARRFFRWAGPATQPQFSWWSGLGVKASKAAIEKLKLAQTEHGFLLPEDAPKLEKFRAPEKPQYALVASLDNISHLRRAVAELLDGKDPKLESISPLHDLPHHAILDRGRLIGFWEYDFDAKKVAWATLEKAPSKLHDAIERTEAFVRDQLRDARSFSLDSPESRGPRIEALRKLCR
ncbi:MAG: winged helix DNA-binding domain-containing protein, partial [Myxococcales bacterium]|nr:winged helix DNA-binding domain-containing protein [Myxococcales bacterium]